MTTNKPPIAAWAPSTALRKLESRHNNAPCILTDGPGEFNDIPLVRLADYQRLQADHERLQAECEYYKAALLEATARSVSDIWKRVSTDKKLDQYLSVGIAQIEEERDRYKAECGKLRQEVEALQGIQPEMPPMPPNGKGLPRYGVRWNGPTQPLSVPKDDGFWTPWHLAQAECEKLRAAVHRLCNMYEVDDYYEGRLREERLEDAVNWAIDAATQEAAHESH